MKLIDLLTESDWTDDRDETADRRVWVHARTGERVEPTEFNDHYAILEDDLLRFLTPAELQAVTGHDTYHGGVLTGPHGKALIRAIFAKGWIRTIHNGDDGHLWLEGDTLRDVHRVARLIAKDSWIKELVLDVGGRGCDLHGDAIQRFLKSPSPENLPIQWQEASGGDA
jgi:hypothetical protein